MLFIIQGFRTIIFLFFGYIPNVLDNFPSGLLQVFLVELRILHGTLNHVIYLIHVGRNSVYSSRVQESPEEGRRTHQPKRSEYNNKDEDDSPRTLTDKIHRASSQKFRQLRLCAFVRRKFEFFSTELEVCFISSSCLDHFCSEHNF